MHLAHGGPAMVDHGLAWLRHLERLAEMEAFAREGELARAARGSSAPPRPRLGGARRRIGGALIWAGSRMAAGAGS